MDFWDEVLGDDDNDVARAVREWNAFASVPNGGEWAAGGERVLGEASAD